MAEDRRIVFCKPGDGESSPMTRSLRSSDHDALALICAIAQTRDARITSAALSNHHPAAGAQLQALGVLTRVGDEAAATSLADHEDTPVALVRSPDGRSFGYFSPQAGWVAASPDDQSVFAVSFETLLPKLLDGLDCPLVSRPVQLLPGLLWEVGGARLPGRSARVPVWIGRRLSDPATWALLLQQFQQRPSPGLRIVLSLTAEAKLPKTYVSGHEIIAVRSVIDASDGFRIDPQILAARLAHGRDDGQPVTMAAEPWDRKKGPWRVNHINAIEVSDEKDETNPDCRVVTSRCPNCGHEWRTRVEF